MTRCSQFFGCLCLGFALTAVSLSGCDQEETVLDVETPQGELEIDRDRETGNVDVELTGDKE